MEHHNPETEEFPRELRQSLYDRMRMFTDVRRDLPEWGRLDTRVGTGMLFRFGRSIQSFYQRAAEGRAEYPRFKPRHRWKSVEIPDVSPSMLTAPDAESSAKWWRLRVKGIPRLRLSNKEDRLGAALGAGGKVVELRVVRTPLRVEVYAVVKHPERPLEDREPTNPVGMDKGLASRLTLSTEQHIQPREVDHTGGKRAQRRLSRSRKDSRSRVKKRTALAKVRRQDVL